MDNGSLWIILAVVIVAVIAGNIISGFIQRKGTFDQKDLIDKIENLKDKFTTDLATVSTNLGTNKGVIEAKSEQILKAHQRLLDSLTGSKRFGIAGELLLENLFKHSGLVIKKQWIQNQSYQKDGTTLSVEFAILHPTGLCLPVDSHWTKTMYEDLLDLRKQPSSLERDENINEKFKDIVKDYGTKARDVNKKYINSPISTDFACIYVPSESLYLELNTHVAENKELWIEEIHRKYKVTFMGPSTFSAYCSAILLGFNSIAVDEKAKSFLKHIDTFKRLIINHQDSIDKHYNKMEQSYRSAEEIQRTSEKIKTEMEKAEAALKDMEDKNDKN